MSPCSLYNVQPHQFFQLVIISLIFLLIKVEEIYALSTAKAGICDNGLNQSPINIDTSEINLLPRTQPFVFINYDVTSLVLANSIKKIELFPYSTYLIEVGIAAGGLSGFFKLVDLHLHWESEHTINGKRFPLEAHFVHYNTIYRDLEEAMSYPGGVAVNSVLFIRGRKSKYIDDIIKGTEWFANKNVSSLNLEISPSALLPSDRTSFYRYFGSFTTPPCLETVVWSIFESKVEISSEQIDWLRHTLPLLGLPQSSYRPVQDVRRRKVGLWMGTFNNKALINCKADNQLLLLLLLFLCFNFLV